MCSYLKLKDVPSSAELLKPLEILLLLLKHIEAGMIVVYCLNLQATQ